MIFNATLTDQQKTILTKIYKNYRASHSSCFKEPWTQLTEDEFSAVKDCYAVEISNSLKAMPNRNVNPFAYTDCN